MFVKVLHNVLGKFGGTLVGSFGSGVDVDPNIEGAGDMETAFEFVVCTTGIKLGTLVLGWS